MPRKKSGATVHVTGFGADIFSCHSPKTLGGSAIQPHCLADWLLERLFWLICDGFSDQSRPPWLKQRVCNLRIKMIEGGPTHPFDESANAACGSPGSLQSKRGVP